MKGSRRTEPPGRKNTTAQLEEDPCRQNNKQNSRNNKQNKQNRQNNIVKSKWFTERYVILNKAFNMARKLWVNSKFLDV